VINVLKERKPKGGRADYLGLGSSEGAKWGALVMYRSRSSNWDLERVGDGGGGGRAKITTVKEIACKCNVKEKAKGEQ
jgi:hypothetical protein